MSRWGWKDTAYGRVLQACPEGDEPLANWDLEELLQPDVVMSVRWGRAFVRTLAAEIKREILGEEAKDGIAE